MRVNERYAFFESMETALEKAKASAGNASLLAQKLSEAGTPITSQAITQWKRVPAARAIQIERITGISRHELRPDVFGPAPKSGEAA